MTDNYFLQNWDDFDIFNNNLIIILEKIDDRKILKKSRYSINY